MLKGMDKGYASFLAMAVMLHSLQVCPHPSPPFYTPADHAGFVGQRSLQCELLHFVLMV
jgi:hypothetical protein